MKSRIKETAETSEEPPQCFIANKISKCISSNVNLSRRKNLERKIIHERNNRHQRPNPETRAEIPVLPLEYQLSENGELGTVVRKRTTIKFWYLWQMKLSSFLPTWESDTVIVLSAFLHRYFFYCIPFMYQITAKQFPVG